MAARILIVEDNPANLDLMSFLLKAFGHTTLVAWSAEEAVEMIRKERLDLVLSDIHLPGMDGCALARLVKADPALRHIPMVAVTASAMVGDRDMILAAGFDGYVDKPIDPEKFVASLEAILQTRSASQISAETQSPKET